MKSSTTRWTTAFAAVALLGLPVAGWSQTSTTPSSSPSAQQQPASSEHGQHGAAQEHIQKAKAALNDVPAASIPARAKAQINQLKRHLSELEKSAAASATASKPTARGKATWANDVAAIDKILTELLGTGTTGAASETPGATGTTGTPKATASAALDETTKSKLMEVRTHVTAFASAMSGAGSATPGATEPPAQAASTQQHSAQTHSSAASSAGQSSSSAAPQQSSSSEQSSSTPQSSSSTQPQPTSTAGQTPAQPTNPNTETTQPQSSQAGSAQSDPQEAKRHLTAARDSLSELTQLPAAAQLQGEARTQVSQLITNFNELITTNTEWRGSYEKVEANVTALLGPESGDPAPAQPPAQAPSTTPGAVGTSGMAAATSLDPAIRAKLVEFREHMSKFEKAAGASGGSTPASPPTGAAMSSSTGSSMTGSSTTAASTTGSSTTSAGAAPPASPEQSQSPTEQSSSATSQQSSSATSQDALRHIEAIEAIVNGRSGSSTSSSSTGAPNPTGTTGSSTSAASGITLDRTQVEQIRMHLAELRKAIEKK